jgi:hypothetical protein
MNMYTGLARVARLTGYPVVEVPGWETRTRPQLMSDVRTITCHHTANGGAKGDYPSYDTVLHGRGPDLPGPLAQYGIGRSGTIYVFAAGSANHAGVSRSVDYEKPHAIGIEAEAVGVPGTPGDWPEPQMDAYAKLCRALIDEFGLKVADVLGHKETCSPVGRKTDPSFDMQKFRTRVAAVKLGSKPVTPQDQESDDVSFSDKHKLTEADVKAYGTSDNKVGDTKSYDEIVRFPPAVARLRRELTALISAQNATIRVLANAIASGGSLTAEQAEHAAKAGAEAALAKLGDLLDGDTNDNDGALPGAEK